MEKSFLTLLLVCTCVLMNAQTISEKLEVYESNYSPEKIYVAHDKPSYFLGDTLWGSIYFVDGRTHEFIQDTTLIYVEWLNADGVKVFDHIIESIGGKSEFDLPLKIDDQPGLFTLRVYTSYQLNFNNDYQFSKQIHVFSEKDIKKVKPSLSKDLTVQFFPEGGHLVRGLKTRVAFTVHNIDGVRTQLEGKLIDESGNELFDISTLIPGIGSFEFTPREKKVFVEIDQGSHKKKYYLPDAISAGYSLYADARQKDKIILRINSTLEMKGARLVGHLRGQLFMDLSIDQKSELAVIKNEIPSGILHFTLFNSEDQPVAERLVFNENTVDAIDINIDSKDNSTTRELIEVSLSSPQLSKSNKGRANIKIYQRDLSDSESEINILNYLLFQSDISERIDNLNAYFLGDANRKNAMKDLLLMTVGWRKFNWQDVLQLKVPAIIHPKEKNFSIAGVIKKKGKDKPTKADVTFTILNENNFSTIDYETDEDGLFYIKGLDLRDSTNLLIQAAIHNAKRNEKKKEDVHKLLGSKYVDISLIDLNENPFETEEVKPLLVYESDLKMKRISTEILTASRAINPLYDPSWSIMFDEITIRAKKKSAEVTREEELKQLFRENGMWFDSNSPTFYPSDLPDKGNAYDNLYEMLRSKLPGVEVQGSQGNYNIRIRASGSDNSGPAAILIDGVFVPDETASTIHPSKIEGINILKSTGAKAIYGPKGAGGILNIITKKSFSYENENEDLGILNIDHPGYYQARQFYMPDYSLSNPIHDLPDVRTSLYWNPDIELTEASKYLQFYTSDVTSAFDIVVEGITEKGMPFYSIKTLKVE